MSGGQSLRSLEGSEPRNASPGRRSSRLRQAMCCKADAIATNKTRPGPSNRKDVHLCLARACRIENVRYGRGAQLPWLAKWRPAR